MVKVLRNISYTFNYIIISFYIYRIKDYYLKIKNVLNKVLITVSGAFIEPVKVKIRDLKHLNLTKAMPISS